MFDSDSPKTMCVIVHNHPIHYKHLLFGALAKTGLNFKVLFTGAFSGQRLEKPLPKAGEYQYEIGFDGPYECAPKGVAANFVWRSLGRLSPNVVIISGYYDVAAWTAWTWAGLHGAKRVLWAESNEFDSHRHLAKELIKRLFVKHCDLAHVYGTSSRRYIERLGMPAERIYAKRAVADTSLFFESNELGPPRPIQKQLIYVGRFAKEKNLEFLLRAFSRLKQDRDDPALVLSLVGYGPLESELRNLTITLGLENAVRFLGKALQAELPAILRRADAFVLPSIYEPWGLVANEAMLCGLPVLLSTQCGCTADLCQTNTGWSFSPWDLRALTNLLLVVSSTPQQRLREMGHAAAKLASVYSPDNCATIVSESIHQVISKPRSAVLLNRIRKD